MAEPLGEKVVYFAKTNFRGSDRVFGIKKRDRRQHFYVVGKTGTGKSELLKNIILQDVNNGEGVGVVDPHGELVEDILKKIPASRINDVVYFNPVDISYPIGFNVLEVPDAQYKHLVVSDLMAIFTKIWANVWSARMEYILQNCILALLDTPGTTLLGIPRILVDKNYRERIVKSIKDPVVRSFWTHEYETWRDQFRNEAIVPIQNKVGQFLNTPFIRNIVGQSHSTLNIQEIMNEGKILLVNVSKGRLGEDNSQLLGAMIITKLQLAAMERVRIAEEERKDFYLYIDEFQNFATDSFASILSEARKYRLNLTVAHQYIGQLVTDTSTKVRDAIFGNVGTMLVFRVGAGDAEELEKEFQPEFTIEDLCNLPNYEIYLKLMVNGVTSRPFSAGTLPPMRWGDSADHSPTIMRVSRERYGMERAEVESRIDKWSSSLFETEEASDDSGPKEKYKTKCWICGKEVNVPFKPDDVRPIYCSEDLKKVEAGEILPAQKRKPIGGGVRAQDKYSDSLSLLGIEFGAVEQKSSPAAHSAAPIGHERPSPVGPPVPGGSMHREPAPVRNSDNRNFERRPLPSAPPSPRAGHFVVRDNSTREMSLSQLRPSQQGSRPQHPQQRNFVPDRNKKGPDLEALRAVLKETTKSKDEKLEEL